MIPRLHYISQAPHLENIEIACAAGCELVQLRAKHISANEYMELAIKAKEITDKYNVKLVVNDIPEIAFAIRAYGIHLGKDDMHPKQARQIVGPDCMIGGSTNSYEDIIMMINSGVDYVGLGPFNHTKTKSNLNPVLGLEGIKAIISKLRNVHKTIPIIAIGGIDSQDVAPLLEIGAYGVAISSAITNAPDKNEKVKEIHSHFKI